MGGPADNVQLTAGVAHTVALAGTACDDVDVSIKPGTDTAGPFDSSVLACRALLPVIADAMLLMDCAAKAGAVAVVAGSCSDLTRPAAAAAGAGELDETGLKAELEPERRSVDLTGPDCTRSAVRRPLVRPPTTAGVRE